MSIQTDVRVKNLEIKVSQLERLLVELKAELHAKVDALTPSKEKSQWTPSSLRAS